MADTLINAADMQQVCLVSSCVRHCLMVAQIAMAVTRGGPSGVVQFTEPSMQPFLQVLNDEAGGAEVLRLRVARLLRALARNFPQIGYSPGSCRH